MQSTPCLQAGRARTGWWTGPVAFAPRACSRSPLCLPVVSGPRAPTGLSTPTCFRLLLGSLVFLPESKHQPGIQTCYKTIQPSNTRAKNYLQHLFRSQLNKVHHVFERGEKKKARLWLYVKSGWIAGLWVMKKRREKTTHTPQTIRPETRKQEWSVSMGGGPQKCPLPMRHPSSDQTSRVWGRRPTLALESHHWHLGAAFFPYSLWQRESPIKNLRDVGSEDACP